MTDTPLKGIGILVTRPRAQATEFIEEIEKQGGNAICFPVIEIVPRDDSAIAADAAEQPKPDIAIFVSRNAVAYGLSHTHGAIKGVTGPATAAAIEAAGQIVEIKPEHGYDSESLLEESALKDVNGKQVRIIRGGDGRELLANTLRERGATVDYLSVYERRLPRTSPEALAEIESVWRDERIHAITVMSIETLRNLITLLPAWCVEHLGKVPLVTPAARVIKEALDRYPDSRPVLAPGPQAADMVEAIISLRKCTESTPD